MATEPLPVWVNVDAYAAEHLVREDAALIAARERSLEAGLPEIQVSPSLGRLLHVLSNGSGSILEIGTLGGYSTIWLARGARAGGRVVTLEINPHHAEVARRNVLGVTGNVQVEVVLGPALETLPRLAGDGRAPFDFVFIDADKENIPSYFDWAVKLTRPGSLIVVDNVVRGGEVADAGTTDARVRGVRTLIESLRTDDRVVASMMQTVGSKGYDGILVARHIRNMDGN